MNFVVLSRFKINLKDRVGRTIIYPKFYPPMRFVVERADVDGYATNCIPPPYQHGHVNFQFSYEKGCFHMMLLPDFWYVFNLKRCMSENCTYVQ